MTQPPPPPAVQPPPMTAPRRSGRMPGWAIALIIGGVLLVVLLVIGMMVGVLTLTPGASRARSLARMSICQANLNNVGKGIHIYLAEYEAVPPNMDSLIHHGTSPQAFLCPCCQSGRRSDYFFHFPPAGDEAPDGRTFIACDWKDNHPDGSRNVLTYEGSVRRMTRQQFERELKLPRNADFAKALREEEGP